MSTRPDPDLVIASWLRDEAPDGASDRLLAATRRQLESTNQRRTWWPARRIPYMISAGKLAIAAAAIVVVAVAGLMFFPRSNGSIGGPNPTASPSPTTAPTSSPSPSASASPAPSTTAGVAELTAAGGITKITLSRPAGWVDIGFAVDGRDMTVSFWTVGNVYTDPCGHVLVDPAVGSSVDDLATALTKIPGTTAASPVPATIDGHDATFVQFVVDDAIGCPANQFYLWQIAPGDYRWIQGAGETDRFWMLDVNGERVVIASNYQKSNSPSDQAELQSILDSIQIVP